ncbi:MAG: YHS domain-containing (seleno)protein [Pseudomonadota bacterium]
MLRLLSLALIVIAAGGCTSLKYQTFADDGVAINGYDPVAYFNESKPVPGNAKYSYKYKGAPWHFASAENLDLFKSDPEAYAPQYGGYCAYAMANGFVVATDPEAWTVRDDKLYLNYSKRVRNTWLKKPGEYIKKGDANWAKKLKDGVDRNS